MLHDAFLEFSQVEILILLALASQEMAVASALSRATGKLIIRETQKSDCQREMSS